MIKLLGSLSTRFPWAIILATLGVTGFMMYQIQTNLRVEPDMTKFLPNSMPTTKANDYYKKNFNYKDSMLIGVEALQGDLMTPQTLREIEGIVESVKTLKVEKTFESRLTEKTETLTFSLGVDAENILSIANLEDALLDQESGSVVTGSLIKKFKNDLNIPSPEGAEEKLPESDSDLERLMVPLEQRIMSDDLFRGSVLSEDKKSTTINIPMIRKWDYKRRYSLLELKTGLSPELLTARFQGKDSTFQHQVWGESWGPAITFDEASVARWSANLNTNLQAYLTGQLQPLFADYSELAQHLSKPITGDSLEAILRILNQRSFNLHRDMATWENFTNGLWEFTLDNIDPASRENLEFQLFNVRDIYDLAVVYNEVNHVLDQINNPNLKFHVAGSPVVTAVFSQMIANDMGLLLPIGVLVIFLILAVSFRSFRGVVIPLTTVVLSMIWALGSMAIFNVPVTAMSSILPIVLLAVGSAYGIHLLNRYLGDIVQMKDKKASLQKSISEVGGAIVMAGMTTFAGFLSLVSSDLSMIRHFGVFSALGVVYALILTLTFSPALLTYWRLPRKARNQDSDQAHHENWIDKLFALGAEKVIRYHKTVVVGFITAGVLAAIVVPQLELEGGQMDNFKDGNVLKESDRFLSQNLTGTGLFNLVFQFRNEAELSGNWGQTQLKEKNDRFQQTLLTLQSDSLPENPIFNDFLLQEANPRSPKNFKQRLDLIGDVFNEEYTVALPETSDESMDLLTDEAESLNALDSLDDLDSLDSLEALDSSDDGLEGLGDFDDGQAEETPDFLADLSAEQVAGLEDLIQRMGLTNQEFETVASAILELRATLTPDHSIGATVLRAFNELNDLYAADVKQPEVLHRVDTLLQRIKALETPVAEFQEETLQPTGMTSSPLDLVRKFYRVFYHDDNPNFEKIPDATTDGLPDTTLTDRSLIGVVLNQAQSGSRESFDGMISPDLKEFQISVLTRKEASSFVLAYQDQLDAIIQELFPANDPYIEHVSIAGFAPTTTELTMLISSSQIKSIAFAFVLVFFVTFFIFRSWVGGVLSILPLLITVLGNFGTMWLLGWKINTGTMLVASISIGIGVDYTIHFLERFKIQLNRGDILEVAYRNTVKFVGKAVLINALSVALGFLVLIASDFVGNQAMGILMAGTMVYSSIGALVFLPALIVWVRPKLFEKQMANSIKTAKAA